MLTVQPSYTTCFAIIWVLNLKSFHLFVSLTSCILILYSCDWCTNFIRRTLIDFKLKFELNGFQDYQQVERNDELLRKIQQLEGGGRRLRQKIAHISGKYSS